MGTTELGGLGMTDIDKMLTERKDKYGPFPEHANTVEGLWDVIYNAYNYDSLDAVHKEGLRMILHKIARAVTGNPDYSDTWDDISGYAQRVAEYVRTKKFTQTEPNTGGRQSDKAYIMPDDVARPDRQAMLSAEDQEP